MRKSNWSDLLIALAMSARDNVLRLFESAMMKARAVISAMKTVDWVDGEWHVTHEQCARVLSQALQKSIGARAVICEYDAQCTRTFEAYRLLQSSGYCGRNTLSPPNFRVDSL